MTSNEGRGGRCHPPYAFTEHGVAMLSAVRNRDRPVHMRSSSFGLSSNSAAQEELMGVLDTMELWKSRRHS